MEALGISQAGLPFELDVSMTPEAMVGLCGRDDKESAPRILVPALEGGRNLYAPQQQ